MASRQVLIGWIGHADLAAMCLDLSEAERDIVHAAVKLNMKEVERPGPLKTALLNQDFAEIHLLTNYPQPVNELYSRCWLGYPASIHEVTLTSPTDHTSVFQASDRVLRQHMGPVATLSPGPLYSAQPRHSHHGFDLDSSGQEPLSISLLPDVQGEIATHRDPL